MPSETEPSKDNLPKERRGIVVGKVEDIDILRPKTLAMPLIEGTHLQVRQVVQEKPWYAEPVKSLLKTAFFALPAAKNIVVSPDMPDLWANVQFNSRPFLNKGANVYGRSPHSENGLGKPVYVREIQEESLSPEIVKRMRTQFSEVLPYWYDLYRQMHIFDEGFTIMPEVSSDFLEETAKYGAQNEQVLLVTEKNTIVNVGNPHVQGLHLVVHSRSKYWQKEGQFRGWEFPLTPKQAYLHMKGFLEMCGILVSLDQILLQDAKLPFYNPEIHFNGNWGVKKEDLPESFRGSQDEWVTYVKSDSYKKRVWAGDDWAITNHGHLYATDRKEQFVHLPRRPFIERGVEWPKITPIGKEEVRTIADLIKTQLPDFIDEYVSGYISEPNTKDQEAEPDQIRVEKVPHGESTTTPLHVRV